MFKCLASAPKQTRDGGRIFLFCSFVYSQFIMYKPWNFFFTFVIPMMLQMPASSLPMFGHAE